MLVSVSATDGGQHPIALTVLQAGRVRKHVKGITPFEYRSLEDEIPLAARTAYRVEVHGDGEILSNPIFVNP